MNWVHHLADVMAKLPDFPADDRFHYPLANGTMRAGVYAPRGSDGQSAHAQDELYVVMSGSGLFTREGETRPFATGDLIFVPAGLTHRFSEFTEDFCCWVIFWGPDGGERGTATPKRD